MAELARLRVGKVIDTSWTVFRTNWKLLLGLVAVILVPFLLLQSTIAVWTPEDMTSSAQAFFFGGGTFALVLLNVLLIPFTFGPATWATSQILHGRRPTFKQAYKSTARRYWAILGTSLFTGLLYIVSVGVPLIGWMMWLEPMPPGADIATIGAFVVFSIYGLFLFWLFIRAALLVINACLLDGLAAWPALKHSFQLTRGYTWRIILILCVCTIFMVLLQFVFTLVVGFLQVVAIYAGLNIAIVTWIFSTILVLSTVPYSAFGYVVITVLYEELKSRAQLPMSHEEVASH